jgi:prepilin-type N-terminal cleavage/methylation domain-containing protein
MKHIHNSAGFTITELLIVIALLGALATGLLATIDPMEQARKGTDATRAKTANAIYEALVRTGDVNGNYPWSSELTAVTLTSAEGKAVLQNLVTAGELKEQFAHISDKDAAGIYLTASADGTMMFLCYTPSSKAYKAGAGYCTETTCYQCVGDNIDMEAAGFHDPNDGNSVYPYPR